MNKFPKIIEIQFGNACNSNCIICPYRSKNYKLDKMTNENFNNFLNQIKGKKIERIIPYLNNEPFLDKNFVERVKKLKEVIPYAEIEISTNVVFFEKADMIKLRDIGIDDLRLSVFGFNKYTYQSMMPTSNYDVVFSKLPVISEIFKGSKTKVSIIMIDTGKIDEIEFEDMNKLCTKLNFEFCRWGFLDRAKNVEIESNNYHQDFINGCEQNRPTERMHILCNGDVIFCCQDWSHSLKCGNIFESSIEDIWNGKIYNILRKNLFAGDGLAPDLCKNCKLSLRCENER